MNLEELSRVAELPVKGHPDRILALGWWFHVHNGNNTFTGAQLSAYYAKLHLDPPSAFGGYLTRLVETKPPKLLKSAGGYRLHVSARQQLDATLGARPATVVVRHLLASLSAQLSIGTERVFLEEAIKCFEVEAYRAAIVMTWNLAYDHLCAWVLAGHVAAFNVQMPKTAPKCRLAAIATRDGFAELKESEVVQICKSAGIVSDNIGKILKERLDRRNIAAHPSTVVFTQVQAEDFILDLVNNVVLKLM